MKRDSLLRHLRKSGCHLKREGSSHSLWTNPRTGEVETVPRHNEIPDQLARKICRGLSVPEIGREQWTGFAET
jgi:predicted RNA binding protein YcfA (HicA-like mRNA interferase family)